MLIKFETVGCPSCKKLSAILDKFGITPDETIVIDETNVDTAIKHRVCAFPTLKKVDDDNIEYARLEGLPSITKIKEFLSIKD